MKFDRQKFFTGYDATFGGSLNSSQHAGLDALLTAAEADNDITDIRWLAYMLATVKHECGNEWQPIEEYSKGQGHKYGQPVTVTDPDGKSYSNAYYGRGYVQLTWDYNYKSMGTVLKNRLYYEPALALQPDSAYRIMSHGMRNGSFTGAKLSRFISGDTCDYVNARKIINGLDQADRIAGYAQKLEKVLRGSVTAAVPGGVPTPQPTTQPAAAGGQFFSVSAGTLNVRSGPGKENAAVATLSQGALVQAQQTQDGWTHVTVPGSTVTGWVSAQYLQPVQTFVVTAASLNVRSGPGKENAAVATLPQGTAVQAQQTQDGWTHVTVPGSTVTGWVSAQYLQPAAAQPA
jgi:uncharacterized protein YraI